MNIQRIDSYRIYNILLNYKPKGNRWKDKFSSSGNWPDGLNPRSRKRRRR